ncbi:MAG: hypothetical protein IT285_16200 [Bdellovibrionales bacterium]|nr:hypothetical protein [Bdellovibrionales bacterium]
MASPAYSVDVKPLSGAEHQTSPSWVLTFVRWQARDTKNYTSLPPTATREPLVVVSDCIQAQVSSSKPVHTQQLSALLLGTDVNYLAAVAPGDFVLVNMLEWDVRAADVAARARRGEQVNLRDDGFKGLFRVQSVRRALAHDPSTGTTTVAYRLQAHACTELNNSVYFNPHLVDASERGNDQLFVSRLGGEWLSVVSKKGINNVRDVLRALVEAFIGNGITKEGRSQKGLMRSPNTHFLVPPGLGGLLGVRGAKSMKDLYVYLFGAQRYAGSATDLAAGLNPQGVRRVAGRFWYTPDPVDGFVYLKAEYWNCARLWGIMEQFANRPINELYTCFRLSPEGDVMPTVVLRQMPFTSEHFKGDKYTRFLSLPRWRLDPAMVFSYDIGREEAARINFVQVFGRSISTAPGFDVAEQTARGNYYYDANDVSRSGLRPYVTTVEFDEVQQVKDGAYRSQYWARLLGDAMGNGHLRLNGTVELAGVVAPIAPGDNAELEGVVYHIEEVTHVASVDPATGKRSFRTRLSLSHGVDARATADGPLYPEMDSPNAYAHRADDHGRLGGTMPGASEEQAVPYRDTGAPTKRQLSGDPNQPFTPEGLRPKGRTR